MRHASAPLLLTILLAGCAAQGSFPSLAPRPVERALAEERPEPPAAEIPSDPALAARLAELTAKARQGDSAFSPLLEAARAAAASAGAAGSDGWVDAQQRVTRAEAARAPTVTALAELDQLGIARARMPTSASDLAAVRAAVAEIQAMADRQHNQLEAVRATLSPA